MEATEAPPQQAPDDMLATGWAAPARACDPNATITEQAAVIAELGARNELLAGQVRELTQRVAVQRATIARLQRAAEPAVMARIGEAVKQRPCACLAGAGSASADATEPSGLVRGRVLSLVRRVPPRWSR